MRKDIPGALKNVPVSEKSAMIHGMNVSRQFVVQSAIAFIYFTCYIEEKNMRKKMQDIFEYQNDLPNYVRCNNSSIEELFYTYVEKAVANGVDFGNIEWALFEAPNSYAYGRVTEKDKYKEWKVGLARTRKLYGNKLREAYDTIYRYAEESNPMIDFNLSEFILLGKFIEKAYN